MAAAHFLNVNLPICHYMDGPKVDRQWSDVVNKVSQLKHKQPKETL